MAVGMTSVPRADVVGKCPTLERELLSNPTSSRKHKSSIVKCREHGILARHAQQQTEVNITRTVSRARRVIRQINVGE